MVVMIHVLLKCEYCKGKAYLPEGEVEDCLGRKYIRHKPCPKCQGSGMVAKWVALSEVRQLFEMSERPHELVSR